MNSIKIIFISFLYFKEGGTQKLEEFQAKAKPYFEKYKIEILHQYLPISKGQIGSVSNSIEQPDMIQIFTAESMSHFQSYIADEDVKKWTEIRNSGLRKMTVTFGTEEETKELITPSASNAMHGIALVSFKDGSSSGLIDFNKKGQSSGLFPKYGIHAENFVKVMKSMSAIGILDYQQPDLIVIFGVDDPSKMKEYISDPDYLKLAPMRDNSLNSYHFFMCK